MRLRRFLPRAWPLVLAVLILGPALGPGFVLSYDMVWVPDLALRADFLGFGSGLPRAVPSDAVVAVMDEIVPGMVLQKLVLLAALVLAGEGARRLAPADDPVAQLAATTFYLWSPLVAERLVIGHWPLLLTYASLPWIFDTARRLRVGTSGYAPIVLWLALASLSAAGGVLASVFAVLCVLGRDPGVARRVLAVGSGALVVNAPWLVAGVLHGEAAVSDPAAVSLFAAAGEGGMPAWLTVLGLGGIWNTEVVPASRTSWPAVVALGLTVALAVAGARRLHRHGAGTGRGGCSALVAAAILGVAVALAGRLAPGLMEWVVAELPGAGILRDGTRALVLLAPLLALLVAHGVRAAIEVLPGSGFRMAAATALVLAPVALLPDLAGGVGGRLDPVEFPEEYAEARTALDERVQDRREMSDLLVLPFSTYRLPAWNDDRPTLDPLGRFMTPDYLASDTLVVSGTTVAGEDRRASRVQALLQAAQAGELGEDGLVRGLRGEGLRWVLLDRSAAAQLVDKVPTVALEDQREIHRGEELVVWELTGAVAEPAPRDTVASGVLWLAWLAYVLINVAATLVTLRARVRRPRRG